MLAALVAAAAPARAAGCGLADLLDAAATPSAWLVAAAEPLRGYTVSSRFGAAVAAQAELDVARATGAPEVLAAALQRWPDASGWDAAAAALASTLAFSGLERRLDPASLDALVGIAVDRAPAPRGGGVLSGDALALLASAGGDRAAVRAEAEAAWSGVARARVEQPDAVALREVLTYRERWPHQRAAGADAACIAHALRTGDVAWQRQCWLDGLARHGWRARPEGAAVDAIVGALVYGDPRLALDYVRELDAVEVRVRSPWLQDAQRLAYWRARALDANRHPGARAAWQHAHAIAPLSWYGLAAAAPAGVEPAALRRLVRGDPTAPAAPAPSWCAGRLLGSTDPRVANGIVASLLARPDELDTARWWASDVADPRAATAGQAARLSDAVFAAAFPLDHADAIGAAAAADLVPAAWLYAFARRESRFDPGAVSRAGARGLMQIMPATARALRAQVAAAGLDASGSLHDPALSARLAARFLAELRAQHGAIEVAAAAYATGPTRVAEWRQRFGADRADLLVELIPFPSVRAYARDVASAAAIYAMRAGDVDVVVAGPLSGPPASRR